MSKRITIYRGSILDVEADAIVNPANSHLAHGGGLARVIDLAAQKWPQASTVRGDSTSVAEVDDAYRDAQDKISTWVRENHEHPLIATGAAGWTSAGVLPYDGVIHAVGPVWGGGGHFEPELVGDAYWSACQVAAQHDCRHVAFPAISAGIFGVPIQVVASRAVRSVSDAITAGLIRQATFALLDDEHIEAFQQNLAGS